MLGVLPLAGVVVAADALFTHADFARAVLDGGGGYLLPLRDNRPTLLADAAPAFEAPEALPPRQRRPPEADRRGAREVDEGHGRREARAPVPTTILDAYSAGRAWRRCSG